MKTRRAFFLVFPLILTILLFPGIGRSQQEGDAVDIYSGFYSRAENYEKVAQESGHSHYIKFYPGNRIARLYIPFPYSKTLKAAVIDAVFDVAIKKTSKSAYIKDKFGLLQQRAVAHLDFVRQIDGVTRFDCGKAAPCMILFDDSSMTIVKPGVVLNYEILYTRVKIQ